MAKRAVSITFIVIIAVVVIIQLIPVNRDNPAVAGDFDGDIAVKQILKRSCYDCHSNQTKYPWYSQVAPVSWVLDKHIREGKEEVNFSNFGDLDQRAKIRLLNEICEEITDGAMPLKSYLLIHRSSRLSAQDIRAICEWAESESLEILTAE